MKVDLRHTKQELNGCYWDNQLVSGRLMVKVTFLSLCCSVPSHEKVTACDAQFVCILKQGPVYCWGMLGVQFHLLSMYIMAMLA